MTENTIFKQFTKSAIKFKDNIVFHYFGPSVINKTDKSVKNETDKTWKTITYDNLFKNIKGVTSYLIQKGIKRGDRIAIVSENRPEWCTAYLAVSLSGGIAVPIDAQLGPDEIRNFLADSGAKAVFYTSKTEANVWYAINEFISSDNLQIIKINIDSSEFEDIYRTTQINSYPEITEEDVASIIYTSGTTGIPKGVELTHKNFCSDAEAIIKAEIVTHKDNVLSILPLHHTYPFMCTFIVPVFLGATVTFAPSLKGPELIATIKGKEVTILIGVPQIFELIRNGILNKIKNLPQPFPRIILEIVNLCGIFKQKLGINAARLFFKPIHRSLGKRFRFFGSGGAKLDVGVMKDIEALGFTVVEGYGLTETSPVVTFNPITKRKPGSVGIPLPSVNIRIMEPEKFIELGVTEEGEIAVNGPIVMKGYYKNPKATKDVIKDGWFFSGDLGYIDKDGYLYVTGRLKEVIVLSSGKNVYPEDIEKQYMGIPLIREICVIGVEDKGVIESIQAVIVPDLEYAKKEQIGNIQEALKWQINNVSHHLPQYMRLKGYIFYSDPLPRTPLGKLRRFMVNDLIKGKKEKLKVKREEDKDLIQDDIGKKVVECITPLLKEKVLIQSVDNLELDLGLDSLARIELVVSLEKAFSMKLPETFTSEVQTVGELVAKIKEYGIRAIKEIEKIPKWKDILETDPDLDDRKKIGLHHSFLDWLIILIGLRLIKIIFKLFFRLKVEGLENLPEKGPYIITPNHASYLDGFNVVAAVSSQTFKDLYSLGFQKYFTGNLREFFARLAHIIPVDTETYLNKALQMSSYVLQKGKTLQVFPEGGRSFDGELMEFKKGVGILSIELNVPVIPAYIEGSFEALPRGVRWPKFTEIKIIFGKPLYSTDLDMSKKPEGMDNYQFFANELRERVEKLKELK